MTPSPDPVRLNMFKTGHTSDMTNTDDLDVETVRQMPPSPGLSFRGRGSGTWQIGDWYTEPGWLRTTRDPRTATGDFAVRDIVAIFGARGRDLQDGRAGRQGQETVFLPGARFTVLRKGFIGTTWLQVVVVSRDDAHPELPADVEVRVRRAVSAVWSSMAAPPVGAAVDDRFVGAFGVTAEALAASAAVRPRRSLFGRRRPAGAASARTAGG